MDRTGRDAARSHRALAGTGAFNRVTTYHVVHRDSLLEWHVNGREAEARAALAARLASLATGDRQDDALSVGPDLPEDYAHALTHQRPFPRFSRRNFPGFLRFCNTLQLLQGPTGRSCSRIRSTAGGSWRSSGLCRTRGSSSCTATRLTSSTRRCARFAPSSPSGTSTRAHRRVVPEGVAEPVAARDRAHALRAALAPALPPRAVESRAPVPLPREERGPRRAGLDPRAVLGFVRAARRCHRRAAGILPGDAARTGVACESRTGRAHRCAIPPSAATKQPSSGRPRSTGSDLASRRVNDIAPASRSGGRHQERLRDAVSDADADDPAATVHANRVDQPGPA